KRLTLQRAARNEAAGEPDHLISARLYICGQTHEMSTNQSFSIFLSSILLLYIFLHLHHRNSKMRKKAYRERALPYTLRSQFYFEAVSRRRRRLRCSGISLISFTETTSSTFFSGGAQNCSFPGKSSNHAASFGQSRTINLPYFPSRD